MENERTVRPGRGRAAGAALLGVLVLAGSASAQHGTSGEWRVHGGDSGFTRYAPLDQINAETVHDLEIVWRRPAVDASLHARWDNLRYSNNLRSTPLMVDGLLYASNGIGVVEAFDPATGETRWVQDLPFLGDDETPRGAANRGVGYWEDDAGAGRILSVRPPYLLATDPETGRLVPDLATPARWTSGSSPTPPSSSTSTTPRRPSSCATWWWSGRRWPTIL